MAGTESEVNGAAVATHHDVPPCWDLEWPATATTGATHPGREGEHAWDSYWEELSDEPRLFREQSEEYVQNLAAALPLDPKERMLDFGCGFGFVARGLAPRVGELYLWDYSANMRQRARRNVADIPNIRFLDLRGGRQPADCPRFDRVLVNSVIQYFAADEFSGWLARWRELLAPGGRLVISDIIPPDYQGLGDILAILKLSARRGFLLRALRQAAGDILGYWKKRRERPLTRFGKDELTQRAAAAGLTVEFLPRNLTHFPRRTTAVFRLAAAE